MISKSSQKLWDLHFYIQCNVKIRKSMVRAKNKSQPDDELFGDPQNHNKFWRFFKFNPQPHRFITVKCRRFGKSFPRL